MADKKIKITRKQLREYAAALQALSDVEAANKAVKSSFGTCLPPTIHTRMQAVQTELAGIHYELRCGIDNDIWKFMNNIS